MAVLAEEVAARRHLPTPALRRAIREAAGVSQQRLADELGVSRVTVLRWEAGTRTPRGAHVIAYTRLLDELQGISR